jgi:hypothetical protein
MTLQPRADPLRAILTLTPILHHATSSAFSTQPFSADQHVLRRASTGATVCRTIFQLPSAKVVRGRLPPRLYAFVPLAMQMQANMAKIDVAKIIALECPLSRATQAFLSRRHVLFHGKFNFVNEDDGHGGGSGDEPWCGAWQVVDEGKRMLWSQENDELENENKDEHSCQLIEEEHGLNEATHTEEEKTTTTFDVSSYAKTPLDLVLPDSSASGSSSGWTFQPDIAFLLECASPKAQVIMMLWCNDRH